MNINEKDLLVYVGSALVFGVIGRTLLGGMLGALAGGTAGVMVTSWRIKNQPKMGYELPEIYYHSIPNERGNRFGTTVAYSPGPAEYFNGTYG